MTTEIKVIDISSYQGKPNWDAIKADGISQAIFRVTERYGVDSSFEYNYKNAKDRGIKVGGYKFSYAVSTDQAIIEANGVINALKGKTLDLPLFLDLEWSTQSKLSKQCLLEIINTYKKIWTNAGFKFGIYCNKNWYNNYIPAEAKDNDFWIAGYPANDTGVIVPSLKPTGVNNLVGWQYSSKGKVNGISGNVDMNIFYKDYTANKVNESAPAKVEVSAEKAKEYTKTLLKHYPFTYCPTLANCTTNKTPSVGSVILFYSNSSRTYVHTGFVVDVTSTTVTTIEGNTNGGSAVIPNGGGVCKKTYTRSSMNINNKYFVPDYYSILVKTGIFASINEAISAIIKVAESEIGYLEKKSNSNLDDKTTNAGSGNYTKYWRDIYPEFQAQPWCACFVTWIIQTAIAGNDKYVTESNTNKATARNYLTTGDKGSEVKTMQTMLIYIGYSCGSAGADGDFGSGTLAALKKFQTNNGLVVDGKYGPASKAKLTELYKAKVAAANKPSSGYPFVGEVKVNSYLNVRTKPSTLSSILKPYPKLNNGNRVRVLGKSGNFYKIAINNVTTKNKDVIGYVSAKYIKKV